ncbi:MAG: hypothetical protein PF489_09755 [Salinivirgaceae bacterium]|nr:hypothetical protein [Salinivirgaceae bacterium]
MKASKLEAMSKVKLIIECNNELEAKVIGLELINAIGVSPDMIECDDSVTDWNTKQFIVDIQEPR